MINKIRDQRFRFRIIICSLLLAISGCSFSYQDIEYSRAEKSEKSGSYKQAIVHYSRVIKREPKSDLALEAARRASRISLLQTKDFLRAVSFYQHLVMYSKDQLERMKAQKKISEVYFEKILDYKKAIENYDRLLNLPHSDDEDFFYRLRVARSHFHLNDFYQSLVEIDSLMDKYKDHEKTFDLMLFKANVLLTTKRQKDAILIFKQLLKKYPKKSVKDNVGVLLSVAYEEIKEFDKAIETLRSVKKYYPAKEFIDLKIKRLRQRAKNQPGARGLRR